MALLESELPTAPFGPVRPAVRLPTVEIVVPTHDEAHVLGASVERLHRFLVDRFPLPWTITVADNGSTDGTAAVARRLAHSLPGVDVIALERAGRGGALRAAWGRSSADIVVYMDVDLSTDLDALLPLVAPIASGHSDVAVGSRLAVGARTTRGRRRNVISRVYNRLLRIVLRTPVRDAQCGFKALRADTARRLLATVRDDGWFFDTELLVRADRAGLRVFELPVTWTDDPDSRVELVRTAWRDLCGVARLAVTERS